MKVSIKIFSQGGTKSVELEGELQLNGIDENDARALLFQTEMKVNKVGDIRMHINEK